MTTRMRRRITNAKRDEIEAEQKAIENRIIRPFETLDGLPISFSEPPYGHYEDILKNPLTIKDSAVLYNSLIRSRSTFVYHAPMFKLHWVKQTAYAKKLAEMDKEKQKEILNDRENKRRFAKATTNSLEARTRTPVLSPDVNARDVMSKLCESSVTLGPHTMDIRIFIAKDSRSDKSRALSEISKVGDTSQGAFKSTQPGIDGKCVDTQTSHINPEHNTSSTTDSTIVPENTTENVSKDADQTRVETCSQSGSSGQINLNLPVDERTTDDARTGKSTQMKPRDESQQEKVKAPQREEHFKSTQSPTDGPLNRDHVSSREDELSKQSILRDEARTIKTQSKSLLSVEDKQASDRKDKKDTNPDQMLSNSELRGSIALPHKQAPLESRKPLSQGQAGLQEEIPKPVSLQHDTSQQKSKSEAHRSIPTKLPPKHDSSSVARPSSTNLQSIENTIMISNLNAIAKIDLSLNDLMKVVASGKASETQIARFKKYIERAKQMGPQPQHSELYFSRGLPLPPNFPRPYQERSIIEKKAPPKPKPFNPMKLTAFQERYLHNATLVFEFLENPNVRYIIPQDSICEILPPEFKTPLDAEPGTTFNDILFSHIWIHNIDEIEEYEKLLAVHESEVEKRRLEDEKGSENTALEEKSMESTVQSGDEQSAKVEHRARSLRAKRKAPPLKKKKALVPPEAPLAKYTTFSFTIHNIPTKFIPIFRNSMKPIETVQKRMEQILKNGSRMPNYYLWYQVDARLDESFAENLRNLAVAEEKKMTGFAPPVEQKKRKPRDTKPSQTKRSKGQVLTQEQSSSMHPSNNLQKATETPAASVLPNHSEAANPGLG